MSPPQTVGTLPHTITWAPGDLPTLRAAYSDRTAALMAYLAAFAYDHSIEAFVNDQSIESELPPPVPMKLSSLGSGPIKFA